MEPLPGPLASIGETERETLFEAVDASDFSLADWIAALSAFDAWLAGRDESRRPWSDMIGYVECCTRMVSPGLASPDLEALTIQALDEYGFLVLAEFQE